MRGRRSHVDAERDFFCSTSTATSTLISRNGDSRSQFCNTCVTVTERLNASDISRERPGLGRSRSEVAALDAAKSGESRCVAAVADCEYGGPTLKFREATRWAAQKVQLGKSTSLVAAATSLALAPPLPPGLSDTIVSSSDESAVSLVHEQALPPQNIQATPAECYQDMSPASFLDEQTDYGQSPAGVPELGLEADPSPVSVSAVDPPTGSQGSMPGSVLQSFYSPKWPGAQLGQLGFDLASSTVDMNDALFTNLLDFPNNLADVGISEPYWNDIVMESGIGNSPVSALHQELISTDTHGDCHIGSTCQPMVLDHPPRPIDQQLSSPIPTGQSHQSSKANTSHGSPLPAVQLPWPKAQKPPPGSKISVGHRIYLAHFKVTVMQAFPLELPFLWDMVIKFEPVRYAALSLSAANLANLQGQKPDKGQGTPATALVHFSRATTFSRQTVEALEGGSAVSLDARLVNMILAVFYELEASSFSSAFHSLSILNVMILSCPEDVLSITDGRIIVRWWLHLRTLITGAQGPYSLYGPEDPTESLISQLEVRVAEAPQMIDLITTKAMRIWNRVLVAKCFEAPGDRPVDTMRKVDDWWRILKGNHLCEPARDDQISDRVLGEDELYEELDKLRKVLDGCDAPEGFQPAMLEERTILGEVVPLHFDNHRQAKEVVDFAFSHIICNQERLRALAEHSTGLPRQFPDKTLETAVMDPWASLLLRTVAGLDVSKCGKENMYQRGIVSSIFYTGLFYPGQVSTEFINDTVGRMLEAKMEFENPFYPLRAFLDFHRSLQGQVTGGRTVFFACSTHDEWTTKETLLSSGEEHLMIVGCEANGRYFNDLVPFTIA
ncbi:hypothetical protein CEP53_007706 [Fusarium sp. AF-6]|nr:hypothetical protein CEP53_007706 [Fusarium sp. AF-6]